MAYSTETGRARVETLAPVDRAPRMAAWVFAALVVVAGPFYAIAGRGQWFFQDGWTFLTLRDGGDLNSLLRAHNGEHWTTLPVLVYRILWNVVGINSYKPYQAVTIGLHLAVTILLRAVIRRSGVSPWVATVLATVFLFYGRGAQNVVWAFQMTFTGAIALGLAHLLLADHPDPSTVRFRAGLLCGLGALMCSGVGIVMVGVVAISVLLRRGWAIAAINTVPLAVIYGVWWTGFAGGVERLPSGLGQKLQYFVTGLGTAVDRLQDHRALAVAVVLVTAVGLVLLAWERRRSLPALRRDIAIPSAFLAGAVGFFALSAYSRTGTFGVDYASRQRFSYVAIALLLPVVAVSFETAIRRVPIATVPLLGLLLLGVPGNLQAVEVWREPAASPAVVVAVANQPLPAGSPDTFVPFHYPGVSSVTLGWLHQGVRTGRIPGPARPSGIVRARVAATYGVLVVPARSPDPQCAPLNGERVIRLRAGQTVNFWGALVVAPEDPDGKLMPEVRVGSFKVRGLSAIGAPVTLHIRPVPGASSTLCGVRPG